MKHVLTTACLAVLLCSCAINKAGKPSQSDGEPQIRVLLAEGEASYRIGTGGGVVVESDGILVGETDAAGSITVLLRRPSLNILLEPGGRQIAINGDILIRPKGNARLEFGGTHYAGIIRTTMAGGKLVLLNVLPLERYLQGVLPHEMGNPGADGYDALMTQAVAARTYAIGKMNERESLHFDVYASVMDQVYRGSDGLTRIANSAISDTRGRVIDYEGELARTYYSACCGGHTSDIRLVWPRRQPADYLYGVLDRGGDNETSFCSDHKYFRWRYSFSGAELGEVLRKTISVEMGITADEVGALEDIRVDKRSRSGRVIELTIETSKREFRFTGDRIRWVLMRDVSRGLILPSVMFRMDKMMDGGKIVFVSFSGGGNGHGVGMCQNGAIAMAKKGYTYEMIISHYYPGSTVSKLY